MTNGAHIPVSVAGTLDYAGAQAVISTEGDPAYQFRTSGQGKNEYWFLVVDLVSLKVLVSLASSDDSGVPAEVQQYVGQGDKLLIFTTVGLTFDNVPQGSLFTMLKSVGAGALLDRAEQMNTQLGTGFISNLSYILAAQMDEAGLPGFEEFSYSAQAVMTFELMPVTINGQTVYTPIQLD
jgi:hypothetical protein